VHASARYRALRDPTEFRREYRLWDYGRPRPIHVDKAVPIANLGLHPGAARPVRAGEHREKLVHARQFVTELVRLGAGEAEMPEARGCQLWIAIEGSGTIGRGLSPR